MKEIGETIFFQVAMDRGVCRLMAVCGSLSAIAGVGLV